MISSVSARKILPRCSRAQNPQHPVQSLARIGPATAAAVATLPLLLIPVDKVPHGFPLKITQICHASGLLNPSTESKSLLSRCIGQPGSRLCRTDILASSRLGSRRIVFGFFRLSRERFRFISVGSSRATGYIFRLPAQCGLRNEAGRESRVPDWRPHTRDHWDGEISDGTRSQFRALTLPKTEIYLSVFQKWRRERRKTISPRLKPHGLRASSGPVEAVPLQNLLSNHAVGFNIDGALHPFSLQAPVVHETRIRRPSTFASPRYAALAAQRGLFLPRAFRLIRAPLSATPARR